MHSGAGVQLQSLLSAVFLANATSARLVVPPWLSRASMGGGLLWHPLWVGRSCDRTYNSTRVHRKKQGLARVSTQKLCESRICARQWPTFGRLFDLKPYLVASRERTCDDCEKGSRGVRLCPRVDIDVHLVSAEANGHCTKAVSCAATLRAVSDALSAQTSQSGTAPRVACLGPLNDWFFEAGDPDTPLQRCAASHPLARELDLLGLPPHPRVAALLPALFGQTSCARCLYARLSERDAAPRALVQRLAATGLLLPPRHIPRRGGHGTEQDPLNEPARAATPELWEAPAREKTLTSQRTPRHVSQAPIQWTELVSNCAPRDACVAAVMDTARAGAQSARRQGNMHNHLDLGHVIVHDDASAISQLAKTLGLSSQNAAIAFDALRCARCAEVVPLDARLSETSGLKANMSSQYRPAKGVRQTEHMSTTSSFFQMILRLHRRLATQLPN
jgi:hypothetical protein